MQSCGPRHGDSLQRGGKHNNQRVSGASLTDEQVVRRYIRNQEKADKASDFADLFNRSY
jgi:hypothetical protein